MVGFVLDFECDVEKGNTYDRKPKEVSKHLNFFHSYIFSGYVHNIRFSTHLSKSFLMMSLYTPIGGLLLYT